MLRAHARQIKTGKWLSIVHTRTHRFFISFIIRARTRTLCTVRMHPKPNTNPKPNPNPIFTRTVTVYFRYIPCTRTDTLSTVRV